MSLEICICIGDDASEVKCCFVKEHTPDDREKLEKLIPSIKRMAAKVFQEAEKRLKEAKDRGFQIDKRLELEVLWISGEDLFETVTITKKIEGKWRLRKNLKQERATKRRKVDEIIRVPVIEFLLNQAFYYYQDYKLEAPSPYAFNDISKKLKRWRSLDVSFANVLPQKHWPKNDLQILAEFAVDSNVI